MRWSLRIAVLTAAVALAGPTVAQDDDARFDGLNPELRQSLYDDGTALVAVLDLKQLRSEPLMQTFRGLFDSSALAALLAKSPNFEAEIGARIAGLATVAAGLVEAKYERTTVVAQGMNVFAALPLGFRMDEAAFMFAKGPLETILSAAQMKFGLTLKGDFVLVHTPGATLTPDDHSEEVERFILLGLRQARGAWAVNFTSPANAGVRAMLAAYWPSAGELGTAVGEADYIGGFLVGGERPELHIYVRYGGDAKAASVAALYDAYWKQQIAAAIADDKAEQAAKAEGTLFFALNSAITREAMMRRIAAAARAKPFGGVVLFDFDTFALREITGALVDRYYREAPK